MIHKVRKPEKDDLLISQEEVKDQKARTWKPISLRLPFLTLVLLATCALIVILQWLLYTSQTAGGVIFAPSINDLPLSKTFGYLYAPTIIAVVYGLLWSWIDLDIKRMEPYYQLCSTGGALAEDSLLLQYPFDFVALVPFQAARRKHWSVFTGGLANIVVLWILTPLQAGIFATEDRVVTTTIPFLTSTSYQPASNQTEPSALYAQHAYNIVWLNEALPPYSTVDFVLGAFAPATSYAVDNEETWNGATKLYSVDVVCEPTIDWISNPGSSDPLTKYNSSSGCSFGLPVKTGATTDNNTGKNFAAMYVGYWNQNGEADWSLDYSCPIQANHTFLVRSTLFSEAGTMDQSLETTTTPNSGVLKTTSLYCEPRYFEQEVNASVIAANGSVISITPVGQKSDLAPQMFDTTFFENAMSSGEDYRGPGMSSNIGRGDIPENTWPDQKTHFVNTNLDMSYLPKMVPFSFAALKRSSLEDYLNPEVLAESYQAAYRLLFVAHMAHVLKSDFGPTATQHDGQRSYRTQALVLVPGFTYAVVVLLGFAMLLNLSVIYFSLTRTSELRSDPTSIASHLSTVADEPEVLALLSNLDHGSAEELRRILVGTKFSMSADVNVELQSVPTTSSNHRLNAEQRTHSRGVRSPELRWYSGVLFLMMQLACISVFAYLFYRAKINNGLALSSNSRFVRQLLQNYIPTAISTTLEPVWTLLTRQLCVLQAFEELRKGKSVTRKSLTLAYTNVPPQLVIIKALRTGHFMLSLLATMAVLGNVLSVALSSLFFEGAANTDARVPLPPLVSLPFQSLNGTDVPFNSNIEVNWQGGTTKDEFYIAMSNAVASSKLPPWTGPDLFYFPVRLPESSQAGINYTVTTGYFGASLECRELVQWKTKDIKDEQGDILPSILEFNVTRPDDSIEGCLVEFSRGPSAHVSGSSSLEISTVAGSTDFCKQSVVGGWWRGNASNQTIEVTSKLMMLCSPKLVTGSAEVTVDSSGRVLRPTKLDNSDGSAPEHFTTTPSDLILQAHQFIVDKTGDWVYGSKWHNDSFSSDWNNYLMAETFVGDRFLNPDQPAPSFNEAATVFGAIYNKLFAILLGNNVHRLFTTLNSRIEPVVGIQHNLETRIFLSLPAFIMAQIILCLYALTTILLYIRRPWRILPRLPTSIGSIIAFFANSHAVREFENTSQMDMIEQQRWLDHLDHKWAYGSFIGPDGRVHIGIEREPFVTLLENEYVPRMKTRDGNAN
ncbi:hypothetical protein KCU95_g9615, partial [Aureobasidium melanogenum]